MSNKPFGQWKSVLAWAFCTLLLGIGGSMDYADKQAQAEANQHFVPGEML